MMDRRTYRETALQPFKASVGIRETLLQSNCGSTSLKSSKKSGIDTGKKPESNIKQAK